MSQRIAAVFGYLDAVSTAIFIVQTDQVVWANSAAAALTGYDNVVLRTMQFTDLLAPGWREQWIKVQSNIELELLTAWNTSIRVGISRKPVEYAGSSAEIATVNDLRLLEHAEQPQNQRDPVIRGAIEGSLDSFYLLDSLHDDSGQIIDFIFKDMNERGRIALQMSREALIGQRLCELFPINRTAGFLDKYIRVVETGQVLEEDFSLPLPNGDFRWLHHQVIRVDDGVALFTRDITERKMTENALHESERRYYALLNQSNDCVSLLDLNGYFLLVNAQMASKMGYSTEKMIGMHITDVIVPNEVDHYRNVDKELKEGLKVPLFERVYRREDGSTFLGEVNISLVRDPQDNPLYVQSIMRDITWRKEVENALRENEERYRIISELISDYAYAFRIDSDGTLVHEWITDSFKRMTGYSHDEIDEHGQYALFHPDDEARSKADVLRVIHGETSGNEYRIVKKSGEIRWVHIYRQPVWDEAQKRVTRMYGVAQDITERKRSESILIEQERLRYELQKEQELNEVKSNLMRTISHEFRTPLTLIVTATDFLDTYLDHLSEERRNERLQAIRAQVRHMSDMLDDISFVVQGTLHHMTARPSRINLEAFCRTVLEEIEMAVGKDHQFIFTTDGQLQDGVADKALIVRIMGNLLSNAVKYSPENSVITVMLYRNGSNAVLQVSDQGIGIDVEEQKHIFEPFYRSNSVINTVGGTGLGLSIVKDCVDLHHGIISVESTPGKGTTFIVHLPQNIE